MNAIRWMLLLIVCIAAWIAALFAGIVAHSVAEFFWTATRGQNISRRTNRVAAENA